ncbi:PRTRC system protein C [Collimonas sp. H4R21]|uniref:PRTRC system protein C n=1 Tax=Collimonas rhizosphaerae TaxID=3126357 RepID=A0ABU9PXS7_9BURK
MQIQELQREFKYNSVKLADPNPQFTLMQVRDFFSTVYPEIISADIEGPDVVGNKTVYSFRRAVGTKGGKNLDYMIADLATLVQINWLEEHEAVFVRALQEKSSLDLDETMSVIALHIRYCSRETAGAQA